MTSTTSPMLVRTFCPSRVSDDLRRRTWLGGLWQKGVGYDSFYPLDGDGVYDPTIDDIADVRHGVKVVKYWAGMAVTRIHVEWCACHSDHPVVAAATKGKVLEAGSSESERLALGYLQAEAELQRRRDLLWRELRGLYAASAEAKEKFTDEFPVARRRDGRVLRALRGRRGPGSACRRANQRADQSVHV